MKENKDIFLKIFKSRIYIAVFMRPAMENHNDMMKPHIHTSFSSYINYFLKY